jgi:hypothetical protein
MLTRATAWIQVLSHGDLLSVLTANPVDQSTAQTFATSVNNLVYEGLRQSEGVDIASLETPLIRNMVLVVAGVDAQQFSIAGGAANIPSILDEYAKSLVNLKIVNSTSLVDRQAIGEAAAALLAEAIPMADTLYFDTTTLKVNGSLVSWQTPQGHVNVTGPLKTVSLQMSGTPLPTFASANITITSSGSLSVQMVIDKLSISTVGGKPYLSVPGDAKLLMSFYRTFPNSGPTLSTATFGNIGSLLSTDANGNVTLDLTGVFALNIGGLGNLNTSTAGLGGFNISMGLNGLPVGVKNEAGSMLPLIIYSGSTPYGNHLGLGTNFSLSVR